MANLSNTILDAIEIMADQKVSAAGYDRTIQATIVSQMNAAKGEYIIRYQGNKFYAYSTDLEKTYRKGATVFVLVPENDFSKHKTILGVAGNVGEYDGTYISEEMRYEESSSDCIIDNTAKPIKLCSYLGGNNSGTKMEHRLLLYKDKDYQVPDNVEDLTVNAADAPFTEVLAQEFVDEVNTVGNFLLRCKVTTSIPQEQWQHDQGEYGFDFIVEIEGEEGYQTIRCSSNSLNGNPLKYAVPQVIYWTKKNPAITKLVAIQAYTRDFALYKPKSQNPQYDIYFSNVELYACKFIEDSVITTTSLFLEIPDGRILSTAKPQIRVQAVLRQRGQEVKLDSKDVTYYWFIEQPDVVYTDSLTQEQKNRIAIGGEGWRYLGETDGNTPIWTFTRTDFKIEKADIKCVLRYHPQTDSIKQAAQDLRYENTRTLLKEGNEYNLSDFNIYEQEYFTDADITEDNWILDDNQGFTFSRIDQKVAVRGAYEQEESEEDVFTTKWIALDLSGDYAEKPKVSGKDYTVVTQNDIVINNNTEIICCFYKNGSYICYKEYKVKYSDESTPDKYYVETINANRTFIYNDAGIAPTETADGQTVVLDPVTLTLVDKQTGDYVTADQIAGADNVSKSNITWLVVADEKDRLIELDGYEVDEDDNPLIMTFNGIDYYYAYGPSAAYHLKRSYSTNANSNEIRFIITYKKDKIIGQAQFYCYKAGDPNVALSGTYCDIIPHYENNNNVYTYFNIRYPGGLNKCPAGWTNGSPSAATNKVRFRYFDQKWNNLDVDWEWLLPPDEVDKYHSSVEATGTNLYTIGQDNYGLLKGSGQVAAQLDQSDEDAGGETTLNQYYNAVIPIGWCDNLNIRLVENSGFTYIKYGSNGCNPIYDSNRPFELMILQDGKDVTNKYEYEWYFNNTLQNLIKRDRDKWNEDCGLLNRVTDETLSPWQCAVAVSTKVNINYYDPIGIMVGCKVKNQSGQQIGEIKLPIHVYKMSDSDISALRGWDGHTLTINQDPAYLLGNMVAAGSINESPETGKTFTGVIIGEVSSMAEDGESSKVESGMMAYSSGERTVFINSKDGSARFGAESTGSIEIKPGRRMEIVTSTYQEADEEHGVEGEGLKIGFGDKPSIEYGSGKFKVDSKGRMTAEGATINGKFVAGNRKYFRSVESGEEGVGAEASYAEIKADGGFSFEHVEYKGEQEVDIYKMSTESDEDEEGAEFFMDKEQTTAIVLKKTEITDKKFSYGEYAGDNIVKGIQYSNGKLTLTGNLIATGATIQGNFCAGDKKRVSELKTAVNNGDLSRLGSDKLSASYVSVGDSGSFTLSSYKAERGVQGEYLKEVTDYVNIEDENGNITGTEPQITKELVSVLPNSIGYTEATINANGFSFGTYAKNQPIDDKGTVEDVQISGIRYRKGNLTITGKITATSGMIGGWTINDSYIASPGGGLKLYADGRISGYGNKDLTQTINSATSDNDWLDMSGRMITWKQRSSTRRWVDQTDPQTGYKYKAFLETPNDTTVASIQSKSGNLSMTGSLGIALNSTSNGSIALNVGAKGGLSIDETPEGATAATVTSDSGTAMVKLTSINSDIAVYNGKKYKDPLETGFMTTLSTYASAVQGEVKQVCYFKQDKNVYQKDNKGNYLLDEKHQRILAETIHDEGWIVVVYNKEQNKYIYKKHPTASELKKYLDTYVKANGGKYSADNIKQTLESRNSWTSNGYTFEVRNCYLAKPTRIIGYAPDEVKMTKIQDWTGKALIAYNHLYPNGKYIFGGNQKYTEYSLTEKYKGIGAAIYDDKDYTNTVELTWKIYTDEDKNVKLLESPDGHQTVFDGFENLM